MSNFRKIRYYAYIGLTIVGVLVIGGLSFKEACMSEPPAKVTLGVQAEEFSEPTRAAMDIMNGFVDCEFLIAGEDVTVKSDDGEPCGLAFHDSISDGHSATAYKCADGKFEILISQPGNIHTQACIVAHELGHAAGLLDKADKRAKGIMNQHVCPSHIVLADDEVAFLRDKFCE